MKRLLIAVLAAILTVGSIVSPAQARELFARDQPVLERNGGGRRDRRPPPPRHDRDRHRSRHKSSSTGFVVGAIVGSVVGAAVASSAARPAPAPAPVYQQPVMVYDPACNCYYYR